MLRPKKRGQQHTVPLSSVTSLKDSLYPEVASSAHFCSPEFYPITVRLPEMFTVNSACFTAYTFGGRLAALSRNFLFLQTLSTIE